MLPARLQKLHGQNLRHVCLLPVLGAGNLGVNGEINNTIAVDCDVSTKEQIQQPVLAQDSFKKNGLFTTLRRLIAMLQVAPMRLSGEEKNRLFVMFVLITEKKAAKGVVGLGKIIISVQILTPVC